MLPLISMEQTQKKTFPIWVIKTKYALVILIVSNIIGFIPLVAIETGLSLGWIKLMQMVLFCTVGFLYALKITKDDSASKNEEVDNINFTLLLSLLICVTLAILYYLLLPDLLLSALGSACAFLLPNIIKSSWLAFKHFSEIEYGVWAKPLPAIEEKTFIFFGGLALKINFSVKANDRNKKTYRSHAPLDKSIGDFFNHFLLIQRNNNKLNVELLDVDQQSFGWKFYHVQFWGLKRRQLDPEANLEEMNIKNHATIEVKRVRLLEREENIL